MIVMSEPNVVTTISPTKIPFSTTSALVNVSAAACSC